LIQILKGGSIDKFNAFFASKSPKEVADCLRQDLQSGMNILHLCASQGYTAHVKALLGSINKEDPDYVNSLTCSGEFKMSDLKEGEKQEKPQRCSALFFAINCGHGGFAEIITYLVKQQKCNVN